MNEVLLGIDVGTTFVKAAVVSTDGAERAHGRVPTPWESVPTGAEIDPHALADAAIAAARDAMASVPHGPVIGIGVTGMAETGVLLDRRGEVLAPAIAWHDRRGTEELEALTSWFGEEFTVVTGLPLTPQWSLVKLRWMQAHMPRTRAGVRWLNVAEWVVRCLGGNDVAELSLASRTGFLDVGRGQWWDRALEWIEVPPDFLPEPSPAGTPVGRVETRLDEARGAVLAVAGHDHLCASVGAGATRPGDVFNSLGTAEAFVRSLTQMPPRHDILRLAGEGITVGRHIFPRLFALLGGLESGLARQRFLTLLGVDTPEQMRALDEAALGLPDGAGGLVVQDVNERLAAVTGIFRGARPEHLWRAALESVEAESTKMLAMLETLAGKPGRLVISGGGARSLTVRALKRAAYGVTDEPRVIEAGARGAALTAGCAAGVYPDLFDVPAVEAAAALPEDESMST